MFLNVVLCFLLLVSSILNLAVSVDVIALQATNFELAVSSYRYAAILFHDSSSAAQNLLKEWKKAASILDLDKSSIENGEDPMLVSEGESNDFMLAVMDATDPEMEEIKQAYALVTPSIKIFRRGVIADWRGPFDSSGIATYLLEDKRSSVQILSTLKEAKSIFKKRLKPLVLGFFSVDMIEADSSDTYALDPWGQFQSAADSLRGQADFYAIADPSVTNSFEVDASSIPAVYLLTEDAEDLKMYKGEILQLNLAEWVFKNSALSLGELTFSSAAGEIFATQFFSSRKLKFILFMKPPHVIGGLNSDSKNRESVIQGWASVSETFKGKAIFAYMVEEVADVVEYFKIDTKNDLPMIIAHEPSNDHKYMSSPLSTLGKDKLGEFVAGVLSGAIKKTAKSEPLPTKNMQDSSKVVIAVGSTVEKIVSEPGKDVLLMVYAPWCGHCKKLRPTYETLARAVQAESRIVIVKIDGTANDIPANWNVKGYPALLWFKSSDKPYSSKKGSVPRPYWDAGQSLHELVSFVQREGSFDQRSLTIATPEQLGSLLGDEEQLRIKYDEEEKWVKRNEGRLVNENYVVDYMMGEIVFDGKRWHVLLPCILVVVIAALSLYIVNLRSHIAASSSKVSLDSTTSTKTSSAVNSSVINSSDKPKNKGKPQSSSQTNDARKEK